MAPYDRDKASGLATRPVGLRTSSRGGTYVYRRKGLLDEIPHVRRIRGVIIVRTVDAKPALDSLRTGEVARYDRKNLGRSSLVHESRQQLNAGQGSRDPSAWAKGFPSGCDPPRDRIAWAMFQTSMTPSSRMRSKCRSLETRIALS